MQNRNIDKGRRMRAGTEVFHGTLNLEHLIRNSSNTSTSLTPLCQSSTNLVCEGAPMMSLSATCHGPMAPAQLVPKSRLDFGFDVSAGRPVGRSKDERRRIWCR
eukprot:756183-Hanusia_phi.AAC.2